MYQIQKVNNLSPFFPFYFFKLLIVALIFMKHSWQQWTVSIDLTVTLKSQLVVYVWLVVVVFSLCFEICSLLLFMYSYFRVTDDQDC